MKAITVRQPYANLIARGARTVEVRTHRTFHRGPLAIHAAATKPKTLWHRGRDCEPTPDGWDDGIGWEFVEHHNYPGEGRFYPLGPFGAVIATANLVECVPFGKIFGDWGWILEDVQPVDPVPAKGRQGLWEWEQIQ
jgi:activating signal cointegrator 1